MERGVGIWYRAEATDSWKKGIVVNIEGADDQSVAQRRQKKGQHELTAVTMEFSGVKMTKKFSIYQIEQGEHPEVKLANNFDMDKIFDLIRLPHLHEPGICHTLSERFKNNDIYTLTGEILLAVNPFKDTGIYTENLIRKFIRNGDKKAAGVDTPEMLPHVFGIADTAYRSLISSSDISGNGSSNQSILVSGESGAGKTETTKFVMQYLAAVSQSRKGEGEVMDQVLSSNPILESFGNARTVRNDNSSRFGKYIKMQFSTEGKDSSLIGATIQNYLLEKIRLTTQSEDERNFHVFYELLAGATSEEKKRWGIAEKSSAKKFNYMNQSQCTKRRDGVKDKDQFLELKKAMTTMKFSSEEQDNIFCTVAGVLHLGNLEFDERFNDAGEEGSEISSSSSKSMDVICKLFEVNKEALEVAVCNRKIQAREEWYTIGLKPDVAEQARDALARFVYGKLFDWLVSRINEVISYDEDDCPYIGLLDIFGFEDLSYNTFEQLCINYANETLQQHFNLTVLRLEQETYEREEIEWSFVNFPDNTACLDLIQAKPTGIFDILDEECIVPKGNDENFARKLYRIHNNHKNFEASSSDKANSQFVVCHYAGSVKYDTVGICEKNKDILYQEITTLVKRSTNEFVRNLMKSASVNAGGKKKPRSILKKKSTIGNQRVSLASQFRTQLKLLMESISATNCFYVRCLKPNDMAKANCFDSERICDQLRAGGVLEAVRVNRAGYPVRISHHEFLRRYRSLANGKYLRQIPDKLCQYVEEGETNRISPLEYKDGARLLVQYLSEIFCSRSDDDELVLAGRNAGSDFGALSKLSGIQLGLTKIFFRRHAIQFVEAQLTKRYGEFVILIQSSVRGFVARGIYNRQLRSVALLQRCMRGCMIRAQLPALRQKRKKRMKKLAAEEKARLQAQEDAANAAAAAAVASRSSNPVSEDSEEFEEEEEEEDARSSRRRSSKKKFRFTRTGGLGGVKFDINGRPSMDSNFSDAPRSVAMDPGDTVLHLAANCCNESDVLKLLENGANVNAKNKAGRTPLHTAALHHNLNVVGILLDWSADACAQDENGNTPLHLAKDPHVARMLLDAGCNPNFVNNTGRTVLIEASDRGDLHVVKALIDYKADVLHREDRHGQTALHIAVRKGHYNVVKELCNSNHVKQLVNVTDKNENNSLHFAVSRDRHNGARLVHFLVQHGTNVNKKNARHQTPLVVHIMTTQKTDPTIAEVLLKKNADATVKISSKNSSLLHVSVERELLDIACSLIKYGAELTETDGEGRMVMDIASRKTLRKLFGAIVSPPKWISDSDRKSCMLCPNGFKFGSRRHHCRHCGRICCKDCSANTVELYRFPSKFPGRVTAGGKAVKDPQRVCKTCYSVFKARAADKESKSGFIARVLGYEWDEVSSTQVA